MEMWIAEVADLKEIHGHKHSRCVFESNEGSQERKEPRSPELL